MWRTIRGAFDRFLERVARIELPDSKAFWRFGRRLRWRLVWALVASGVCGGATWYFRTDIFQWALAPADGLLSPFPDGKPVFTAPTEMFGNTIGLVVRAIKFGFGITLVLGIYTMVHPALPRYLQRFFVIFIPASVIFFIGGAAFAYYVMMPRSLAFLLHFGVDIAVPLVSITSYLELFFALMFWMGVVFELPLAMFMLAKLRILSYQRMKSVWKFVPLTASIFAAIITPTVDYVNMFLVMIPMIALYVIGLLFAWIARPSDGDFLFMGSIWHGISWVARRPVVAFRRVKNGIRRR